MPKSDKDAASAPMTISPNEITTTPDGAPLPHPSSRQEHGAQVHLTGAARSAARGGLHGDIVRNTMARDAEVAAGRAADGTTVDGSTPDGRLPPDVHEGADQVVYGEPGKGEGRPGSRPGDEKVAEAEAEAAKTRAEAKSKD